MKKPTILQTEPVTIQAAVISIITLAIAIAEWAGVDVPPSVIAALAPAIMAAAFLARSKVTPVENVEAYKQRPPDIRRPNKRKDAER